VITMRPERGTLGTRERLAGISHYFLSEPESAATEKQTKSKNTYLLPVLVDSELTQVFVYALARALHARGVTSLVLHVESSLRGTDPRSSSLCSQLDSPAALHMRLKDDLGGAKPPPHVCLIPVTNPSNPHLREYERALIAVAASLPGLKRSYLSIKQLAVEQIPTQIGTIIVGATSHDHGRQFFDRLAAGAMRFLGRTLTYIGSVITPGSGHTDDDLGANAPGFLSNVVDALIRDGFLGTDAGNAAVIQDDPQGPLT